MPGAALPSAPVPAFIPLSLLEAIRNLDTPLDDGLDEPAPELVAKRLGLSDTVGAQIARYRETAERSGTVDETEAAGVFRLVGRRPDAELAFADAGRRAARYAARATGARALARMSPGGVARRLAARAARTAAREAFGADLRFRGGLADIQVARPLSVVAWPEGEACGFYSAGFAELLRVVTGFEGAIRHVSCQSRGDAFCAWRASAEEGYA